MSKDFKDTEEYKAWTDEEKALGYKTLGGPYKVGAVSFEMDVPVRTFNSDPENQEIKRNPDGTFPKGVSGNPAGRPPGKSLKEYWKERFSNMSDEEKEDFSAKVAPELLWQMAEGRPKQDNDVSFSKPLVISFDSAFNEEKDAPA